MKESIKSYSIKVIAVNVLGEEGDTNMGNPLHKLFKKIFTAGQKEQENLQDVVNNNSIDDNIKESIDKRLEAVQSQEKQLLKIEDYRAEDEGDIAFEEETNVIERALKDYIATKVYEKKLMNELQEQGITKTTQISKQVIMYMLDYPGMTESRVKNLLSKFKGYVYFRAVSKVFTKEEWDALEHTLDWSIHIEIHPIYKEVKIKDVFKESAYVPLHKLAKIKEISKLGEITTAFLVSYKNYTGVGEKKYKKTLEILAQYAMKDSSLEHIGILQKEDLINDYEICLEPHLYELFSNYTLGQIGVLYGLDIEASIKSMKLKQIQGKSINTISGLVKRPALERGLEQIKQIIVPSLAFEGYANKKHIEVLKYRFEEGYTLEETAEKIGHTLEATSKIQIQALEELTEILRSSKLVEILTYLNKGDYHVTFKVVEDVLGECNKQIIALIKHNAFHDLSYNPIFDMIFLHEELGEAELMATLAKDLPEAFEMSHYVDKIKDAIHAIGIKKYGKDVIPNLLQAMGYTATGKLYSKQEISTTYILDMIFRHKIKKAMYLDEDTVEFLVEEAKKEYNYALGNNILTIEQRLKEAKDILQVGSNLYLHSSRLKYKEEVVEEIGKYLDELSQTQNKINAHVLYNSFKDKLKGSSIQDAYGLYEMFFYYFGERYKKENEGSLNIIFKEEQLETSHFIGLENVTSRLQQLINNHMDAGYIKTEVFLQEIRQREEMQDFLQTNYLSDCKEMAEVLKLVDDTLLGEDDFLYRVDSRYQSMEELELSIE